MAVVDDTLDGLRYKEDSAQVTGLCPLSSLVRLQDVITRYGRSADGRRAIVWPGWTGNRESTYLTDWVCAKCRATCTIVRLSSWLLVLQEVSVAMLRQMQHIQHAGADPTADELRFSTADLLQALRVWPCV